jgi:hypothetical protein
LGGQEHFLKLKYVGKKLVAVRQLSYGRSLAFWLFNEAEVYATSKYKKAHPKTI